MEAIRLTSTTVQVLEILRAHPQPVYGLEVATKSGLMTGTIYPILSRLERAGWVIGTWDTADSTRGPRRRFYELTPQARAEVEALIAARSEAFAEAQARAARFREQRQTP